MKAEEPVIPFEAELLKMQSKISSRVPFCCEIGMQ